MNLEHGRTRSHGRVLGDQGSPARTVLRGVRRRWHELARRAPRRWRGACWFGHCDRDVATESERENGRPGNCNARSPGGETARTAPPFLDRRRRARRAKGQDGPSNRRFWLAVGGRGQGEPHAANAKAGSRRRSLAEQDSEA